MNVLQAVSTCRRAYRKKRKYNKDILSRPVPDMQYLYLYYRVDKETRKPEEEKIKYVPLQAREGDLAIFLLSGATEVVYEGEKYYIVPQSAILMLEREESL
jgi:hypothetical protein